MGSASAMASDLLRMKKVRVLLSYPAPDDFDGVTQAACRGGSFRAESVAPLAWTANFGPRKQLSRPRLPFLVRVLLTVQQSGTPLVKTGGTDDMLGTKLRDGLAGLLLLIYQGLPL